MERRERLLWISLAAASLVLRCVAYFRYRFDADEQQHLHVVWGWTAGMVQYRDFFDNHGPLFHLTMAPLLALLGERSTILLWMRAPMLLLWAFTLWATWRLGRALYDRRVAAWAALLLSLFPPFFLKSLEFRTDTLFVALWMGAIVALVTRRPPLLAGLLLGAAFAVSLKATLLVATVLVAGAMTVRFTRHVPAARALVHGALGFAIVPGALALLFVALGAWDALVYCTVTFHRELPPASSLLRAARVVFPFAMAAVAWIAWRFRGTDPWRHFFATGIGVFTVTLTGFWTLISPRDFLPLMPVVAVFAAAEALRLHRPLAVLAGASLLCCTALWYYADGFRNRTAWHVTMLDQALRLTRPGELLLDVKGETIYRRRPFYYALELITRHQIARGVLRDTIPEDVVRTRTYVAQADGPMWPPRARAFLSEHFVNLGRLRAAGQWIGPDGAFTIAVPGEYVVLTAAGEAQGRLDGSPQRGARRLGAGTHRWEGEPEAVVVWAPAFRRGHSPFHLRDLDF